jgi:tRNA(Ile)-lysidine synthase
VLLGHTLDDQAETVLLRLARGSGSRSLSGMPAESGRYRRPLLAVARATTRTACQAQGLTPWDDPHNDDRRFARVRVRLDVVPALTAALGPGVAEALARTAALCREDTDALDAWAAAAAQGATDPDGRLDVEALAALPTAVRGRVLRAAAVTAGAPAGSLGRVHVAALDALVTRWHGQQAVALPGGVSAERACGRLLLHRAAERQPDPKE